MAKQPRGAQAAAIRAWTFDRVIAPQLARQTMATVRASQVHDGMGLKDSVPAICGAINSKKFLKEYDLVLIEQTGRPVSTATTFVFMAIPDVRPRAEAAYVDAGVQDRLEWFARNRGQVVSWSVLSKRELAQAPKGIYRPANARYALSVKIIPDGPYPDELPDHPQVGAVFRYHQEEVADHDPSRERSNLGMANCMRDAVAVGIIRRRSPKPNPQYEVIGIGRVLDWQEGFFHIRLEQKINALLLEADADPISDEDARRRVTRAIVARRGQPRFRGALMRAYGGRCAISGCDVAAVLEAAHIRPYLGDHTDVVRNGLLLRADLHTLFDLHLLRIEPKTKQIRVAEGLRNSDYGAWHGKTLARPAQAGDAPDQDALAFAWGAAPPELDGEN